MVIKRKIVLAHAQTLSVSMQLLPSPCPFTPVDFALGHHCHLTNKGAFVTYPTRLVLIPEPSNPGDMASNPAGLLLDFRKLGGIVLAGGKQKSTGQKFHTITLSVFEGL